MRRSGVSWVASVDATGVNSMMKYARICPFIVVLGLYMMSNLLSSMAHFISFPEVSGLCSICFIGYSIRTSTICMSLEVRSEFSRCSYQREDQLLHFWIPLLCSSHSSAAIVDRLLYSVPFSDQGSTS